MPASVTFGLVAWIACSLFGFLLALRAPSRREQTGRVFVGVGALLMAVSTVVPSSGPKAPPLMLFEALVFAGGVLLLAGLILAYPAGGLRSSLAKPPEHAQEPSSPEDAPEESQPDDGTPGRG